MWSDTITWIKSFLIPFTNDNLSSSDLRGGESLRKVLKSPTSFSFNDKLFIDTPDVKLTFCFLFLITSNEAADEIKSLTSKLLSIQGEMTVDEIHKKLGRIMWNKVGMGRNEKGLNEAVKEITDLREEFWTNVKVTGKAEELK